MKKICLILNLLFLSFALSTASAQKSYNGNLTIKGKTYKVVNNRISVNAGDFQYKIVLGNLEEIDAEVKGYVANDIESAKIFANVIKAWNKNINAHNITALKPLYYENVVKYYSSFCNRNDIGEILKSSFAKYPAFRQRITNVEIDVCASKITFTKYVKTSADAPEKSYPCYFYLVGRHSVGDDFDRYTNAWIVKESDKVTDANVEKKEAVLPTVNLNKNWTVNQLFVGNVNKKLNFMIWDFWNDGDEKDYPLLSKLGGPSGRDSFSGPVRKHYNNTKNYYYCEGTSSGAPAEFYHNSWWNIIWRYNATTGEVDQFGY